MVSLFKYMHIYLIFIGNGDDLQDWWGQFHQEQTKFKKSQAELNYSAPTQTEAFKRAETKVRMAVLTASYDIISIS